MGRGRKTPKKPQSILNDITWQGPRLLVLAGLPGSGKSTWAHWVQKHRQVQVVSADQIRLEIWDSLQEANRQKSNHKRVFTEMHDRIEKALRSGQIAIADATNLYPRSRQPLYQIATNTGSEIEIILFRDPAAFGRNKQRPSDQQVPDEAMKRMSLVLPDLEEALCQEGTLHVV